MSPDWLTIGFSLGLVLLLITVSGLVLKQLLKPQLTNLDGFKIKATLSLGHKQRLVLVEVAGQSLVLAVTPGQINCLINLSKQTVAETNPALLATPPESPQTGYEKPKP